MLEVSEEIVNDSLHLGEVTSADSTGLDAKDGPHKPGDPKRHPEAGVD
jgi:hypothetical protein